MFQEVLEEDILFACRGAALKKQKTG